MALMCADECNHLRHHQTAIDHAAHHQNQNPFGLAWWGFALLTTTSMNKMELVSRLEMVSRVDQSALFRIPLFFLSLFFAYLMKLGSSFSFNSRSSSSNLKLKKQAAAPITNNNINA
eukprot:scaffold22913_cov136-Skeletonema_dohrnii-CCMP3373.AAC.2